MPNPKSRIPPKTQKYQKSLFVTDPYEEVEDGYIDDRGFYTTPNGSFLGR
jgi:hypothetical protein